MPKKYNILLSAYACEPNKGSEPGIGWNWAITLNDLGHNVTVITRKNNKEKIINFVNTDASLKRIKFIYYDLPKTFLKFKKFFGVYLYYELWQIGIYNHIKTNVEIKQFDVVHHITFGVFRQPSHLYKFKIPFVFGPLGGGEMMPKKILEDFSLKYRLIENTRKIINNISLNRTALKECFKNSSLIFARTNETKDIINRKYNLNAQVSIDIGLFENEISDEIKTIDVIDTKDILYVGRLTYWKGLDLAIRSFHAYNKQHTNSKFTIIGSGKYYSEMKDLVCKLQISDKVEFIGQIPQKELLDFYKKATALLFPTLHDAGPLVTLEALKVGLPIVALNLGGLGQLLTSKYPTIVNSKEFDKKETINDLSNFLLRLSIDKEFYDLCSKRSIELAKQNTWKKTVLNVYKKIESFLETS